MPHSLPALPYPGQSPPLPSFLLVVIAVILHLPCTPHAELWMDLRGTYSNETVDCPPGETCHFTCYGQYASCLYTSFNCSSSNCTIHCLAPLSCTFITLICDTNSSFTLECSYRDSCLFLDFGTCEDFSTIAVPTQPSLGGLRAFLTLLFTISGYTILNGNLFPDGTIQVLSADFARKSNKEIGEFAYWVSYSHIRDHLRLRNVVRDWGTPAYNVTRIHPYVVAVTANISALVAQTAVEVFADYMPFVTYISSFYNREDRVMQMDMILDEEYETYEVVRSLERTIGTFAASLFSYPNDTFVSWSLNNIGGSVYRFILEHSAWNCTFPAPFYPTYCYGDRWYSNGEKVIGLPDLLLSMTLYHGGGDFKIQSVLMMERAHFISSSAVVVMNEGELIINASVVEAKSISFEDGGIVRFEETENFLVNVESVVLGNQTHLLVRLSSIHTDMLQTNGEVTIEIFNTSSSKGSFQSITLIGYDRCYECNFYRSRLHISSCSDRIKLIILLSIVIPTIIVLSGVIIYLQRTFERRRSMKKLTRPVRPRLLVATF